MKLVVGSDDGARIRVRLSGNVTRLDLEPSSEPLGDQLGGEAYQRVVLLDMSDVDRLDSTGVGWLLQVHRHFHRAGGRLVLHTLPTVVLNVLKVLSLDHLFHVARDEREATHALAESSASLSSPALSS